MFCSAINPLQNNIIKIISNGEKDFFSVNGEIQYKDDENRFYGNNIGFVVSGNAKLKAEKLLIKEINFNNSRRAAPSNADKDVKATGSGLIFASAGYIITNYHVVENSSRFVVEINEGG